jgi:hypothetical protein
VGKQSVRPRPRTVVAKQQQLIGVNLDRHF